MLNKLEYQTVILAAFLHDIGKFFQRGEFALLGRKQHPYFSADFVSSFQDVFDKVADPALLKELVQRHHENASRFAPELLVQGIEDEHRRTLSALVSKADNLSSGERGERAAAGQDFRSVPLASVLERLNRPNDTVLSLRFHARPLSGTESLDGIFPESFPQYQPGELKALIEEFGNTFSRLFRPDGKTGEGVRTDDFDCLLSHLVNVVYRYTWCIPSDTQQLVPDVSLFDHLKTTAAIAACLYRYHSETGTLTEKDLSSLAGARFCLLAGDVSGIQSYIFGISNIGTGGVARRLRSRSLFVQLITEACALRLLKDFGLPLTNVLMAAGGNFHLLLPNGPDTGALLDRANEGIDRWFLTELNGEMALNLAYTPFDGEGFSATSNKTEGFAGVLREVSQKLALKKLGRFQALWQQDEKWRESGFVIDLDFGGQGACRSCGKFPRGGNNDVCPNCERDRATGQDLPDRNVIAFFADENGDVPLPFGSASLFRETVPAASAPHLAVRLNSCDLAGLSRVPAQGKFLANYVPKGADGPMTFGDIAGKSMGRRYLGFLKMDADNMGETIIFGLKAEGLDTVSRLATLSRQIDWFFSGWVQHLLATEFRDCYTVFSGGDDVFLVGPWNEILDLADRIQLDFRRYTGNPRLTLSAGVLIAADSYPISRAAEVAREAVERSKKKPEKNSITLLGHTLTWEDWAKIKVKWAELGKRVVPERISSGFLYSLLQYGRMWQQYRAGDTLGLRFQPLLAYNVGRSLNGRDSPVFCRWAQEIIALKPEQMSQPYNRMVLDNLGLLAQLLILRKEE